MSEVFFVGDTVHICDHSYSVCVNHGKIERFYFETSVEVMRKQRWVVIAVGQTSLPRTGKINYWSIKFPSNTILRREDDEDIIMFIHDGFLKFADTNGDFKIGDSVVTLKGNCV